MEQTHKALIEKFYQAFQNGDAEGMVACYHPDIEFQDPAFGKLKGEKAKNMWRMLIERSDGNSVITFKDVQANEQTGSAYWEAKYLFKQTGRQVHNKIQASFVFKEGKIIQHHDHFNFWKWSSMALGTPGKLLGFTGFLKKKVRKKVLHLLDSYTKQRS